MEISKTQIIRELADCKLVVCFFLKPKRRSSFHTMSLKYNFQLQNMIWSAYSVHQCVWTGTQASINVALTQCQWLAMLGW